MYDKFGHCVVCHRDLMIERVVDMKVVKMFGPEHDETQFLLDDNSKMRVCICKTCKAELSEESHESIMACVVAGWAEEIKTLDWTPEKKEDYIQRYSQKEIVVKSEGLHEEVLNKRLEEFKESKNGPRQ